jgi:hypothetical protein
MARSIPLIAGARYFAGANLPFYVSRAMVTGYLENRGFRNVRWHDRETALPGGLDPTKDPQYSDNWDEWAEAEYSGLGSGVLDAPADPAWLRVELPAAVTAPIALPAAASSPPPAQSTNLMGAARVAPAAIITDPVIVRQRRLGVAASVVGGLLVAWFGIVPIVRQRTQKPTDEVQP